MGFGGTFGPAGNLVPFGIIKNILGEQASGYDAAGRIKFLRASGQEYTPDRVDTLLLFGVATEISPPLAAVVAGIEDPANDDVGLLETSVPDVDSHGLPTNFGPGRGKWIDPTGRWTRLRLTASAQIDAPVVPVPPAPGTGPVAAEFLALMPPDNAATIAVGAAVLFPQNGQTTGPNAPVRTGPGTFQVPLAGLYRVSWQCSVAEAAQLMIRQNGALVPTSVVGRATGTNQLVGTVLLACGAGDILEIINPPGNAAALTMTPTAGGTHAVSATLLIEQVGAGGGSSVGGTGGIDLGSIPSGSDVVGTVRNFNAVALNTLFLTVECVHSVQG